MDNRKILNETFTSYYFNPSKTITKNNQDETLVDFYIFFTKNVSLDNLLAFHVPSSYIYDYATSSRHSEEEAFIKDILLHHKIVEIVNNPNSEIEELYLSLIEYFCYGQNIRHSISSYPERSFGIIALFDEDYHSESIYSIVEPEVNEGRFHYKNKLKSIP